MTPEQKNRIETWYVHALLSGQPYTLEPIHYYLCERLPTWGGVTCIKHAAGFCGWCWECDMPLCSCGCNLDATRKTMWSRPGE